MLQSWYAEVRWDPRPRDSLGAAQGRLHQVHSLREPSLKSFWYLVEFDLFFKPSLNLELNAT